MYWQLIFVMIHLHIALSGHGMAFLQLYIQKGKVLPVLKEWEHKGYLTLIYDEKIAFILNVEKLPSKEKLIEESRYIK